MSKFQVYVSCPKTVPEPVRNRFINMLGGWKAKVSWWVRGSAYDDGDLLNADAVVVILPSNAWGMRMDDIPAGTRSEIKKCLDHKKPLYLGYTPVSDGLPHIYSAGMATMEPVFTGVKGTCDCIKARICAFETTNDTIAEHAKIALDQWDPPKPAPAPKYNAPLFNPKGEIIIYGTPGGYDRRLLLLLR